MLTYTELSGPEQQVWDAFAAGTLVNLRSGSAGSDDPRTGDAWGEERTVRAEVLRALLLDGRAGRLWLAGARIVGPLDLADSSVGCAVTLEGCRFEEPVVLRGASMRSTGLIGCWIPGLDGWLLQVDGNLFFEDSVVAGRLTLTRAHITGELRLSGVHLTARELLGPAAPDDAARAAGIWALWAGGLVMDGGCFARKGFTARGGLRLVGAQFNGGLFLERATIDNPGGDAISGEDLFASTMMLSEGFTANGAIRLPGATVRSRLSLDDARLTGGPVSLDATRLRVGDLQLTTAAVPEGAVDLQEAQAALVHDNEHSWPADIRLDGFVYASLPLPPDGPSADGVAARLEWLDALPGYAPQPYEQLASWYRKIGHDDDARRVLLAKQRRRRRTLPPAGRVWGVLLDVTVGYGYRPWQAGLWLIGLLAIGTTVFGRGTASPVQPGQGAPFNPFVYTLDLLVPIGGFGQRTAWYWTGYHQWLGYGLIAAGWLLTTAVLAGITRSLNRA
ncbi:oxidoreductase [Kitasatospora sp. NBC_00240]|uniref:oxidoreductase n=1 Tax=Kitasatospora sp. NBC_00240 TaxID=2903567 RepID=UPI002256D0EE|nr:oxidoreductase [Kitasatospora sp. NBC_00240]MCX5215185.1 oxidoreductase [Kitasatospora sp. NBC_00240]